MRKEDIESEYNTMTTTEQKDTCRVGMTIGQKSGDDTINYAWLGDKITMGTAATCTGSKTKKARPD